MDPYTVVLTMQCGYSYEYKRRKDYAKAFEIAAKFSSQTNCLEKLENPNEQVYDLPVVVQFESNKCFEDHKKNEFGDLWSDLYDAITNIYGENFVILHDYNVPHDDQLIKVDTLALPITADTPIHLVVPSKKRSSPEPDTLEQSLKKQCV